MRIIDFIITDGNVHTTTKIIDLQNIWYLINPTNLRLNQGVCWHDNNMDLVKRREICLHF